MHIRVPRLARLAQVGCPGAFDTPTAATIREARIATLCLLNFLREWQGLHALVVSKRLSRAARRHSRDMVARQYFGHRSPSGLGLSDRVLASRYPFLLAGENIGAGSEIYGSPIGMIIAWASSPTHLANLLSDRFEHVGLGLAAGFPYGGEGTTYTMIFGARL